MNKILKLEAVRGFAACYVVLHHTFGEHLKIGSVDLSFLLRFGQEAVILFFLLSGFVIGYAYELSKDKTFKMFFIKRFLRIYIPLLAVFILNYFVFVLEGRLPEVDLLQLFGNLFMLQDVKSLKPNVICAPLFGNTPLWSLSYEWWFYMLFFLIRKAKIPHSSIFVYVVGIISAITYLLYPNFFNRELMYLMIWWLGVDMAKFYLNKTEISIKTLKVPLIFLLLVITCLSLNVYINKTQLALDLGVSGIGISPYLELRHFTFTLFVILLAVLWKKYAWIGFDKTIGPFRYLANISFGLYISHWFLLSKATYLSKLALPLYIEIIIYFIICIFFSYFIERILYVKLNKKIMKILFPIKEIQTRV